MTRSSFHSSSSSGSHRNLADPPKEAPEDGLDDVFDTRPRRASSAEHCFSTRLMSRLAYRQVELRRGILVSLAGSPEQVMVARLACRWAGNFHGARRPGITRLPCVGFPRRKPPFIQLLFHRLLIIAKEAGISKLDCLLNLAFSESVTSTTFSADDWPGCGVIFRRDGPEYTVAGNSGIISLFSARPPATPLGPAVPRETWNWTAAEKRASLTR